MRRTCISDTHSPKSLIVILLILLLSITDAYLTLHLTSRGAVELNPIMAYYLDHSPLAFFGMKYLLTCASIIVILMVKDFYLFKSRVQGKVIFVFHLIVLIPRHCGVLLCTPHSSGFRKPCIWAFSISLSETAFSIVSLVI
jgi:hypothetical protein